jgi:hypothetical protein
LSYHLNVVLEFNTLEHRLTEGVVLNCVLNNRSHLGVLLLVNVGIRPLELKVSDSCLN